MQTPAEKYMVQHLADFLNSAANRELRILNIGAGQSLSIERQLEQAGCRYISDRVDIDDCEVDYPRKGEFWQAPVENMDALPANRYKAAFANYLLEHVGDIARACSEIYRVVEPGGMFFTTIPNPSAPEFLVSRLTPTVFHRLVRRGQAWETKYSFRNATDLERHFSRAGFAVEEIKYWSFVEGYLCKFALLGHAGRVYDKAVSLSGIQSMMGNVCLIARKPF